MSTVLDLVDQTCFRPERAAGVTNVIQWVCLSGRALGINGLRLVRHRLWRPRVSRAAVRQAPNGPRQLPTGGVCTTAQAPHEKRRTALGTINKLFQWKPAAQ